MSASSKEGGSTSVFLLSGKCAVKRGDTEELTNVCNRPSNGVERLTGALVKMHKIAFSRTGGENSLKFVKSEFTNSKGQLVSHSLFPVSMSGFDPSEDGWNKRPRLSLYTKNNTHILHDI